MNNPGRYLALTPPINGATAATGTPYFTSTRTETLSVGYAAQFPVHAKGLDHLVDRGDLPAFRCAVLDWLWWHDAPVFRRDQRQQRLPRQLCAASGAAGGATNPATGQCAVGDWFPDLRTREVVWGAGVMVKF